MSSTSPSSTIQTQGDNTIQDVTSPTSPTSPFSPSTDDPNLIALRALFPSTSDDILEAVLEAHSGNLQNATETLLDINNPSSTEGGGGGGTTIDNSEQLDLDAELARHLMEEEESQERERIERRERRDRELERSHRERVEREKQPPPITYQTYVPKRNRSNINTTTQQNETMGEGGHGNWVPPSLHQAESSSSTSQRGIPTATAQRPEDERDELDMLAENFSKFAEQGKKSFGSFVSKMKEQVGKIDELIQQSASPSLTSPSSERPPSLPPKSNTSSSYFGGPTNATGGSARTGAQWTAPQALPRPKDVPIRINNRSNGQGGSDDDYESGGFGGGASGGRRSRTPSPGPPPPSSSSKPTIPTSESKETPTLSESSPTDGEEGNKGDEKVSLPTSTASTTTTMNAAGANTPTAPPKDPRKDFSKLGLYPRRSVSLLDDDAKLHTSSQQPPARSPLGAPTTLPSSSDDKKEDGSKRREEGEDSESDDDLEYVRNPFDED